MVVEDIIDELYGLYYNCWADSLEKILKYLSFPIRLEYSCGWEEYLYERSNRIRYIGSEERGIMSQCLQVAMFSFSRRYRFFKMIAIYITGNRAIRNEKTLEIYKQFKKIYGRQLMFVSCFDDDIAFVGSTTEKYKKSEVIISDWFGRNTDHSVLERIEEIDFSLFSDSNIGSLFASYLWAIARPYVKYRESKMFLMFGCGQVETYELFLPSINFEGETLLLKVDRDETFRLNASYYPELYGDDYFIDDAIEEDDILDIADDEDAEFEWTMLEMDLANEDIEKDEMDSDYNEYDDYDEYEDYDEEDSISNMNPEEMLRYIRGE